VERLATLYRTSNENVELVNQRLMLQVQAMDQVLTEKDKEIKGLREEVIDKTRETYAMQEQIELMQIELQNEASNNQRLQESLSVSTSQISNAESAITQLATDNRVLTSKLQGL
jgi:uncharacterized protein (DUF3084 family)